MRVDSTTAGPPRLFHSAAPDALHARSLDHEPSTAGSMRKSELWRRDRALLHREAHSVIQRPERTGPARSADYAGPWDLAADTSPPGRGSGTETRASDFAWREPQANAALLHREAKSVIQRPEHTEPARRADDAGPWDLTADTSPPGRGSGTEPRASRTSLAGVPGECRALASRGQICHPEARAHRTCPQCRLCRAVGSDCGHVPAWARQRHGTPGLGLPG
jgi:hypothetical protein